MPNSLQGRSEEDKKKFIEDCFTKLSNLDEKKPRYLKEEPPVPQENGAREVKRFYLNDVSQLFKNSDYQDNAVRFFQTLPVKKLEKAMKRYSYPKVWSNALTDLLEKTDWSIETLKQVLILANGLKRKDPKRLKGLKESITQKMQAFCGAQLEGEKREHLRILLDYLNEMLFERNISSKERNRFKKCLLEIIKTQPQNDQGFNALLENRHVKTAIACIAQKKPFSLKRLLDALGSQLKEEKKAKKKLGEGGFNTAYKRSVFGKENRVFLEPKHPEEVQFRIKLPDSPFIANHRSQDEEWRLEFKKYDGDLSHFVFPSVQFKRSLTQEELLWVLYGVLKGIKTLHDEGIAHIDLKEANVFYKKTKVRLEEAGEPVDVLLPVLGDLEGCRHLAEDGLTINADEATQPESHTPPYIKDYFEYSKNVIDRQKGDVPQRYDFLGNDCHAALVMAIALYYGSIGEDKGKNPSLDFFSGMCGYTRQVDRGMKMKKSNDFFQEIKEERDKKIKSVIKEIGDGTKEDESLKQISEVFTALMNGNLDEALNHDIFNSTKGLFDVLENQHNQKKEKYAKISKNLGSSELASLQRSALLVISQAKEWLDPKKRITKEDVDQWIKDAQGVLVKDEKCVNHPNYSSVLKNSIEQLGNELKQKISLQALKADSLIDKLQCNIEKGIFLPVVLLGKEMFRIQEILAFQLPKEKDGFFDDLLTNLKPSRLREMLRSKSYQDVDAWKEAVNRLIGGNEPLTEKTAMNLLVCMRAFKKLEQPEQVDQGLTEDFYEKVKVKVTDYLNQSGKNHAKLMTALNGFFNNNRDYDSLSYKLTRDGFDSFNPDKPSILSLFFGRGAGRAPIKSVVVQSESNENTSLVCKG